MFELKNGLTVIVTENGLDKPSSNSHPISGILFRNYALGKVMNLLLPDMG